MIHYAHYSDDSWQRSEHAALCEHNRREGDLLARAENSGSEGYYVEVARWSFERERWERYCHFKFLGGEDRHREDWPPQRLAEHYAREINNAADPKQAGLALIHRLPNWGKETPREKPDLRLALARTYLLFQEASQSCPIGPIVAAGENLAEAMRSFGYLPSEAEGIIAEH